MGAAWKLRYMQVVVSIYSNKTVRYFIESPTYIYGSLLLAILIALMEWLILLTDYLQCCHGKALHTANSWDTLGPLSNHCH